MGEDLPQEFGPYTLHELINRGGMAEIYRATMPGIGGFEKTVAIKKILPHLAEDEEFISMLIDEARIIESLDHSNIAQVYDLGELEERYYIAMEYVHGVDVDDVVAELNHRGEALPIPHVVYILSSVCEGLHYAHTKTDESGEPLDVVHRDVSLHNIMLSFAGEVKLIDFGVAQAEDRQAKTQNDVIKGKLLYMSPEQAKAEGLDGRADLFSAGLCAYKMLTGLAPFEGDNDFQVYNNVLSKEIAPPSERRPEIPEELDRIVMKLLRRDRDRRYQEGYTIKQELEPLLHEIAPGYTANRLSRYVEQHFSHLVRDDSEAEAQQAPASSSSVAPETPAPQSRETGQQEADLVDAEPSDRADADVVSKATPRGGEVRQRAPAENTGEAGASVPAAPSPEPAGRSNETPHAPEVQETDRRDEPASISEAPSESGEGGSSLPPIAWGVFGLIVLIAGMIGYGLYAGAFTQGTDATPSEGRASTGSPPTSEGAATIRISLKTEPSGAAVVRRGTTIGRTPITFSLPQSQSGLDLTLRKEGYRERTFRVVPARDLERTIGLGRLGSADRSTDTDSGASDRDAGAPSNDADAVSTD